MMVAVPPAAPLFSGGETMLISASGVPYAE